MRKCYVCGVEIPSYAKSENTYQKNRLCSLDCAVLAGLNKIEKAAEDRKKKERKEYRKAKLDMNKNDYSKQFRITKGKAQKLANLLDAGRNCICCSEPRGRAQFCGGHYKTAKAHPELALDLLNIHGQKNKNCNQGKSGNISGDKHSHGYTEGLIRRYGQWIVDYLTSYHPPKDYTVEDLRRIGKEYNAEIRHIRDNGKPSRDWRAIPPQFSEQQ